MSAGPLRVGLIGAGTMGRVHAEAWQALARSDLAHSDLVSSELVQGSGVPVAELSAMYTPDDPAREFARRYGLRTCDTLEALFAETEITDLCTPTPSHVELTLAAARAGKHVICEKPIALSLHGGLAMQRGCRAAGVRLFIAQVVRFFPAYRAAQRRVASGEIGSPRVLRLSRVSAPPMPGSWLLDESLSGGVPIDLMLHDLDYARWLAGEVAEVYAVQSRRAGRVMVQASLTHDSGALSLVEAGWAAPSGVFRTSFDLAGTAGVIEWTSDAPSPLTWHGPPPMLPPASPEGASLPSLDGDPYGAQLRHAAAAILSGAEFLVTPDDALSALSLGLAVAQSLASGRPASPERWT